MSNRINDELFLPNSEWTIKSYDKVNQNTDENNIVSKNMLIIKRNGR